MTELAYRPPGIDGTRWSWARRQWIAATQAGHGRTQALRLELAGELKMSYPALQRWAKRCGWPGVQRHNGRSR